MEASSKHAIDISRWIECVIDSCVTYDQIRAADKLVTNFRNMWVSGTNRIEYTMLCSLRSSIIEKEYEISIKRLEDLDTH